MARSASAPSPSAAKAAVSTSASGGVVEVVSVSFVSFNVSVIWLSSNLPCAWGVVLSQPLSLWAHQHTVPHRKCRCQIPTSLAERYTRRHAARDQTEPLPTLAYTVQHFERCLSFGLRSKRKGRVGAGDAARRGPGQRDTHARRERAGPGAGVRGLGGEEPIGWVRAQRAAACQHRRLSGGRASAPAGPTLRRQNDPHTQPGGRRQPEPALPVPPPAQPRAEMAALSSLVRQSVPLDLLARYGRQRVRPV